MSGGRQRVRGANRAVLLVDGQPVADDGAEAPELAMPLAWLAQPLIDLQGLGEVHPELGFTLALPRWGSHVPGRGVLGALTVDCAGERIADHLLLKRGGALVLSDGDAALEDLDVLLGALRWAATVGLTVLARPATPALERGVWAAGPEATARGLASVAAEGEALGVHRWAIAAQASGATVHLLPLWSAAGVEALRHHQARGVRLSGGTTPHHAFVVPQPTWRAWPVCGDDVDRAALQAALADGTLTTLSSGGRPGRVDAAPLSDQPPLAPDTATALALSLELLGPSHTESCWAAGPRAVLGLPPADDADGVVALQQGAASTCERTGTTVPSAVHQTWGLVVAGRGR